MEDILDRLATRNLNRRLKKVGLRTVEPEETEIDVKSTSNPYVYTVLAESMSDPSILVEVVVYPRALYEESNPSHWNEPEYLEKL